MNRKKLIKRIVQLAPIVMIAVMIILYMTCLKDMSVEEILSFTPSEPVLAAAVILVLYALKSLSFVFPFAAIAIAAGMIFPTYVAVPLNLAGIVVFTSLPYAVGKYAEKELVDKIAAKNKKADEIRRYGTDNQLFTSFFLRVINILPCDAVSMLLGSMGYSYKNYEIGSFLGIAPGIVATTIIGSSIQDPGSPEFITAVVCEVLIAAASVLIHKRNSSKNKRDISDRQRS